MATLDEFLNVAAKEVGYKEGKNNDNKYGKWYGMNNQPWCAIFISWCANQVGILNTKIPKYAGCGAGYKWFKDKGLFTSTPKAGYIGFLKPTIAGATASHTFIVEKVSGKTITTIEGNLDDSVKRYTRKTTDSNILGFGIVEFDAPSPKPEPKPEPSTDLKVGDKVEPIKLVNYKGVRIKRYDAVYYITEIVKNRVVLSAKRGNRYYVWAAMNIKDIKKVG